MKKIKGLLILAGALMLSAFSSAQSTITGTIMDAEMNAPMPGVNIVEKGTTNGVSTDFDGKFSITTNSSDGVIVISFIGYLTQEIPFSGDADLGEVTMQIGEFGLDEVQIIASVAVDRKTPVAVSTVKAQEIEVKLGTQEFPEILKSTPGVYATRAGGGFGDGRINLRGFSSENVAVLINGVPVNDMENGTVYWSNWAGLSDVTSSMQVQRGLGAARVAVPSIGGTINILSKTTDVEQGGNFFGTLGNDGYTKIGATYSTGLLKNDWAMTVSAAKTDGDGYVDGTEFNAVSYFVNISKQLGEDHKLSLTAFGAKQRHGQRQNRHNISTYRASERGIRYNSDWGYKNGEVTHIEDNFYHKPQISLNHYWDISEKATLSTALYGSFGSGGGGGTRGENKFTDPDYKLGPLGPVDLDRIVDENIAAGANGSESILRASRNDHNWYGVLSTLKVDLTENIVLLGGLDLRKYKGEHFYEVTDLLGGQYFADDSDINEPNRALQVGDKFNYYNDGLVNWVGGFAQAEYDKDKWSAFVSLNASNTGYKRVDYFQYLDSDPLQESDWYNFFGYGAKGGANYRITDKHNVFANIGYFEKAAGFDAVFINYNNTDVNEDAENQKITSFEIGYGYRSSKLAANVNLYHTRWNDRTYVDYNSVTNAQTGETQEYYTNLTGVNALHQGIELDFTYRATDKFTLTGMASFGDWTWTDNVENAVTTDEDQNIISVTNLHIKGLKVADAAQTTAALGAAYEVFDKVNLTVDYNYFGNIYADYDPNGRSVGSAEELQQDPQQAWKMPDYSTFDASLRFGFKVGELDAMLIGRINNIFNTEYISDALDGSASNAETALVWYGVGRTFSVGAKFNF